MTMCFFDSRMFLLPCKKKAVSKQWSDLYEISKHQCLKWTVAQSPNATNILFERPKAAPN